MNKKRLLKMMILFSTCILIIISIFVLNNEKNSDNKLPATIQDIINDGIKSSEMYIYIDLTQSMLYLIKENQIIKKYPIAHGTNDTPSPIGIWKVVYKARNWGSGFGTRWMGLDVPCSISHLEHNNDFSI